MMASPDQNSRTLKDVLKNDFEEKKRIHWNVCCPAQHLSLSPSLSTCWLVVVVVAVVVAVVVVVLLLLQSSKQYLFESKHSFVIQLNSDE